MSETSEFVAQAREGAREEADAYRGSAHAPWAYVLVLAAFSALVAATAGLAVATGRRLPADVRTRELVLFVAGTHKLSRLLTKDPSSGDHAGRSIPQVTVRRGNWTVAHLRTPG